MKKYLNSYGNVDIRYGVPVGYAHVKGDRLTILCRKLGLECAPAFTGWQGTGRYIKPKIEGVVVGIEDAEKLANAIAERERQREKNEVKNAERRARAQERDVEQFLVELRRQYPGMGTEEAEECAWRACRVGSRRVGRSRDLCISEKVEFAVVAHARHSATRYDRLLDCGFTKDEARGMIVEEQEETLKVWRMVPTKNEAPCKQF